MRHIIVVALAAGLAACTGEIGEDGRALDGTGDDVGARGAMGATGGATKPGGPGGTPGAAGPGGSAAPIPDDPACAGRLSFGPSPTRRLTRKEYDNTVKDLLDDDGGAQHFVDDGFVGPFDNNLDAPVTPTLATQYMEAAERLARRAVARGLVPCAPTAGNEEACAREFIVKFGRRAYRRPLADAEIAGLVGLYRKARTDLAFKYDFTQAIRLVLQGMLQSASFLHHIERGVRRGDGTAVALTPYEIASRLSYFLWQSMPDDALRAAADAKRLGTAAEIEAQARRMLADPRARAGVRAFYTDWLELERLDTLEKSKTVFPNWTPSLGPLMRAETTAFIDEVVWGQDSDGSVRTLLSAPFSFVNGPLASALYGMRTITGDAPQRVDLDPAQRAGLLTQPSIMALLSHPAQTSPVRRGLFVRERLLCMHVPEPVPGVDTTPPQLDATKTTRERTAMHRAAPACWGCHQLLDPVGLGFENYSAIGRYRTTENNLPIDATGELTGTPESDGAFKDGVGLAKLLSTSKDVQACLATEWFRYAMARPESKDEACAVKRLKTAMVNGGGNLREILVAITGADTFRHAQISAPAEVCQ